MIAKKYEKPKVSMPHRDGPGRMDFKEGTGNITAMCSMGDFLEMYKIDATMQVRTPESIDPERTNPHAPWASTVHTNAGSGNPIVARLVIQASEMLKVVSLPPQLDQDALLLHMHQMKEMLLACETVSKRITTSVTDITEKIKSNSLPRDNYGRSYNPFPHIPDLVVEASNFLVNANKVVRLITQLPGMFISLKEDSNFDKLHETLAKALPSGTKIIEWVKAQSTSVRRIVDLRNFAEHPRSKKTEISDFKIMPNGQIRVPVWGFEESDFMPIDEEMHLIVEFLTQVAEGMFISCLEEFMVRNFPLILFKNEIINPDCPVPYHYSIDISQLKFPTDPASAA